MQFMPSTWARYGLDGNGDGTADPHNLYDAARSSANLLCTGQTMKTEADMLAGFFRYNHSQAYTERVLARAYGYQLATEVVPVLVAPLAEPPPVPPDSRPGTARSHDHDHDVGPGLTRMTAPPWGLRPQTPSSPGSLALARPTGHGSGSVCVMVDP